MSARRPNRQDDLRPSQHVCLHGLKFVIRAANAQNVRLGEPFDFKRRQGAWVEDLDDDLSPRSGERPRAAWMDAISAELRPILAECLSTIRQLEPNTDRVRTPAAGKIHSSIRLA